MPNDIDLFQALVLAVVQGVTELFPVSSLGHAVILPHLLVFCSLMPLAILGCVVAKNLRIWGVSWLIMLLCFYFIAGPESLSPHWERYALVLVVRYLGSGHE